MSWWGINKWYFLVWILVFVVAWAIWGMPKKPPSKDEIDLSPEIVADQRCYIWNTEAGDRAMLSMDIRAENVIGELYYFPAAGVDKTGIFKGKVISLSSQFGKSAVDATWEARMGESSKQEELVIIFDDNIATPQNLPQTFNLQRTDCGDDAMD